MSTFEVGQILYWVNSQGQERSGTVVGFYADDEPAIEVRVDVSDADGPMTLPFYLDEVFETRLAAWESFRALEVLPHLAYVEGLRQHWQQLDDKSWIRLQHLRSGAAARGGYETDGSFQGLPA